LKVAARALSIALILLSLLMGMLLLTVIYSARRIRIETPTVKSELTDTGTRLIMEVPIYNEGFHDITDVELRTDIVVELTGDVIATSTSYLPMVAKGGEGRLVHVVEFDLTEIARNERALRALMLNNTNLIVVASLSLVYAYMFEISLEANASSPWGAPMSGLVMALEPPGPGEDEITAVLSFANNASFGYNFKLEALNELGYSLGNSSLIYVDPGASFEEEAITIPINTALWTGSGSIRVHFFIGRACLALEVMTY